MRTTRYRVTPICPTPMILDLGNLVKNPVFIFATGALGGLFGTLLKGRVDIWTSESKRRQDSITHFFSQIEELAPSYYLMSNHAYLLSWRLDGYLQDKRELQMSLLDPDQTVYKILAERAEKTAAEALFEAGRLYRVITERFFIAGGDYVVPDQWANKALVGLHDKIMALLIFDTNVLLKYIDIKTERQDFLAKLKLSDTDPLYKDLGEEYTRYKDWVLKKDKEVKLLAVNARAYNDLFALEMKKLYQDVWKKSPDDPLQATEVKNPSGLTDSTRRLIQRVVQENDRVAKRLAVAQVSDADSNLADAFLSLGWSFYESRQWDLALGGFKKAIAACPASAAAHNSLANVYANKKDYESAASEYTQACALDPINPLFKQNHGRMRAQQGQEKNLEEAVSLYGQAIGLGQAADRPDDRQQSLRYNDLGLALSSLKRWKEAIAAFGQAIVLLPLDPVLYSNLALTYESSYDDQVAAREAAAKSTQLQPARQHPVRTPPDQQPAQPLPLPDLSILDAAAAEYSMAATMSTGDDTARYERNMAAVYRKAVRWKEAADTYQSALGHAVSDAERVETHYQIGRMYQDQKLWNQAGVSFATALQLGGDKNSLHADSLIYALQQSGTPISPELERESIKACLAAIEADPNEIAHHARLGNIYFKIKSFPYCLDERDKVVRMAEGRVPDKEMAGYYNQLALAYRRLEIWDMALDYYHRAVILDPAPDYQRNRGLALQAAGLYEEAKEPLIEARKSLKDDLDILLSLVQVYTYASTPDYNSAIELCNSAIKEQPDGAAAHFLLGQIYVAQGRFIDAASEYQKAVDLTNDTGQLKDWLHKGIAAFDEAIQADPNRIESQYGRAQMLYRLGDYDGAQQAYGKAQALVSSQTNVSTQLASISIQNALGQLSWTRDDFDGARSAWEKALDIAKQLTAEEWKALPDGPLGLIYLEQITNNLGTAYDALSLTQSDNDEAQRLKKKALDCYRVAALNSPKTSIAHYNLARSLYQQKQFDKALSQFQEALRLSPPDALARRTLLCIGNCYYRMTYVGLALDKWEAVAGGGVDFPEAHYNLGVVFWAVERYDEAAKRWQTALKASPALLDAEYNLGVLNLKLDKRPEAIAHWKKIIGEPGFESLADTIQAVEKGETPAVEIRDIREV